MNILSVREVADEQPKSKVALEKELLEQHAEEQKLANPPATEPPAEVEPPPLDDTLVLSHINKKYQKGYTSFDELLTPQTVEKEVELPEDVSAFYKFKQETGRGLSDYMKIQRDFVKENPDTLLAEYIASPYCPQVHYHLVTTNSRNQSEIDAIEQEIVRITDIEQLESKKAAIEQCKKNLEIQLKKTSMTNEDLV